MMSLQLVDRSIKYLRDILEDVPIRIGKLLIPTNFILMKMEEDSQIKSS